jgi:hypothetical protein
MSNQASDGRIVQLNRSEAYTPGQQVYLAQEYYSDSNTTLLEVPRYGWQVKAVVGGIARLEYQRPNMKLLMNLTVETKYLRKEV